MPVFDTPEPITATIDSAAGHVRIIATDRADTVVEIRPSDESREADVQAAGQTQVEYASGQLLVRMPKHRMRSAFGRSPSVEVTLELPSDSRVTAEGWGNFRAEGRLGDSTFHSGAGNIRLAEAGRLKLRSGAGDISVGRAVGHVDASTGSGKVWIGEMDGSVTVKSSNGDIVLGEVTGEIHLKTANGNISIDRALAVVDAKTAAGNVRVGEVVRGSVVLMTSYGEIEFGVRTGTAARLDVSSRQGQVRSDLDAADGPEPTDETVEVRARTGFGDILIRRR